MEIYFSVLIENVTVCPNFMWSVVIFFNLKAKLLLIFKEKVLNVCRN